MAPRGCPEKLRAWLRSRTSFIEADWGDDERREPSQVEEDFQGGVYVITLEKRREHVMGFMQELGMRPLLFRAIPKNSLDFAELVRVGAISKGYAKEANRGRIACNLSHAACLLHALEQGGLAAVKKRMALVFEDDIDVEDEAPGRAMARMHDFYKKAGKVAGARPLLGYFGYCFEGDGTEKEVRGMYRMVAPKCRHAYFFNGAAAETLFSHTLPQAFHGDETWGAAIRDGKIEAYGMVRPAIWQRREKLGTNLGNVGAVPLFSSVPQDTVASPKAALGERGTAVVALGASILVVICLGIVLTSLRKKTLSE
ncbi:Glycosyltransferase family 25 [Durusdinium trenchii]|uniref:Glycosyltransferase family 25 n=1 Tax=Durusdinium trenchii TaxID=1381693 RepID=A0ABP0L856_9DINO